MTNLYTIKKGEKYPIYITIKNKETAEPIDLTGSIIRFQLKDELKDEFYIIDKTVTEETDIHEMGKIIDPQNGKVIIRFTDEDFERLVIERIYYITIWWQVPEEGFSKVISSNGCETFKFMMCHP